MTQVNSSDVPPKKIKVLDESTRLLKDFLEQRKENELENLLEEAYHYGSEFLSDSDEKLSNFLQNVCCYLFRERLDNIKDDKLSDGTSLSDSYVQRLGAFCYEKQLNFEWNNFIRRLDIERRVQTDKCNLIKIPIQIVSEDDYGLSSLGNLKKTKAFIQTQFDISDQLTNEQLSSKRITASSVRQASSGQKDVFIGTQGKTNRKVAVKASRDGKNDAATIHEAEIQSSIAHQGVPTIISLNRESVPIIVEPFIEGKDWASKIDSQSLEEQINTLIQVGGIMAYVHRESKIIHGDLKPENVMIDDYGQVYIIDWGLAVKADDNEEKRFIQGNTPAYCPPEVFPPEGCNDVQYPATPATDVYMLGGILYQIVVQSHKTFNEELKKYGYKILGWHNHNKFPNVSDVPKEMREVLAKALAYKTENRYQDAGEFVAALKKYQTNYQKTRRFNENKEKFVQWKEEELLDRSNKQESERNDSSISENTFPSGKNAQKFETARITNGLTSCVNEFASIREEMDKEGVLKQNETLDKVLFFNVLKEELQARTFLLDCSINDQDYGQADALSVTQGDVATEYQRFKQATEFCQQTLTKLQEQRTRIASGKRERKLNQIRKDVQVIPGIFLENQTAAQQGLAVKLSQSGVFGFSQSGMGDDESYKIGKSWASILDLQTLEEQMNTLLRVGAIMSYVHRESKIVHGCLCPENVMFHHYDEPYVVAWDFAINLDDEEEKRIFRGGVPAYWAPEVCPPSWTIDELKPATPAVDVYMLGGILYQIVAPSHKTFNEAMEEVSLYERTKWKLRNIFPEISDVTKEMRAILAKALAYKPEDRYQDAGEFVDALKAYQKMRRFNEIKERFAQVKAQAEKKQTSSKKEALEAARVTNDLNACVNEFTLIRNVLEEDFDYKKNLALKDESFLSVLKEELQARSFLLERSVNFHDYVQARALAETQIAVVAQYRTDEQTPEFFGQIETDLQMQRGRIEKGVRIRKRNKLLTTGACVLLILNLFIYISFSLGKRVETEKIQILEAEIQTLLEQNASLKKNLAPETKNEEL